MKRLALVVFASVLLGGCSVSVNTDDEPQVIVLATETVRPFDTPDQTEVADSNHVFDGTLKVSGQAVNFEADGRCWVTGIDSDDEAPKLYDLTAVGGPAVFGFMRFHDGAMNEDECWMPFTGGVGYITDAVVLDVGIPGVKPIVITHDQFSSDIPLVLTITVP